MDELSKILELFHKVGWQPIAAALGLLILLRVSEPKIVAGAVARVYGDCRGAIIAYWSVREKYHEAELDAIRARARRDRAIEAAYRNHEEPAQQEARSSAATAPPMGVRRTGSGLRRSLTTDRMGKTTRGHALVMRRLILHNPSSVQVRCCSTATETGFSSLQRLICYLKGTSRSPCGCARM